MKVQRIIVPDDSEPEFAGSRIVYSAADKKAMFIDAIARGQPPHSQIVNYRWIGPNNEFCAVVRNTKTGKVNFYGIDTDTRTPYRVIPQEPTPERFQGRSWISREYKIWIHEKRWEVR